jgi:hypothetical protein
LLNAIQTRWFKNRRYSSMLVHYDFGKHAIDSLLDPSEESMTLLAHGLQTSNLKNCKNKLLLFKAMQFAALCYSIGSF